MFLLLILVYISYNGTTCGVESANRLLIRFAEAGDMQSLIQLIQTLGALVQTLGALDMKIVALLVIALAIVAVVVIANGLGR